MHPKHQHRNFVAPNDTNKLLPVSLHQKPKHRARHSLYITKQAIGLWPYRTSSLSHIFITQLPARHKHIMKGMRTHTYTICAPNQMNGNARSYLKYSPPPPTNHPPIVACRLCGAAGRKDSGPHFPKELRSVHRSVESCCVRNRAHSPPQ